MLYMSLTQVSHMSCLGQIPRPRGQVVECVITACQSRRAEPVMQIEFSFHPYIMDRPGDPCNEKSLIVYTCMGTLSNVKILYPYFLCVQYLFLRCIPAHKSHQLCGAAWIEPCIIKTSFLIGCIKATYI